MQRYTVAIDLDDTLYDFVGALLSVYNWVYEDHVQKRDITDWEIHKFLKPECKSIFKEFATPKLFESLEIPKQIIDLLSQLHQISDIYFVTSCAPTGLKYRANILKEYIPFYNDGMLVRLKDKSRFVCDYILDDNPSNCIYSYGKGICVAQPWNEGVANRKTVEEGLKGIISEIKGKVANYV